MDPSLRFHEFAERFCEKRNQLQTDCNATKYYAILNALSAEVVAEYNRVAPTPVKDWAALERLMAVRYRDQLLHLDHAEGIAEDPEPDLHIENAAVICEILASLPFDCPPALSASILPAPLTRPLPGNYEFIQHDQARELGGVKAGKSEGGHKTNTLADHARQGFVFAYKKGPPRPMHLHDPRPLRFIAVDGQRLATHEEGHPYLPVGDTLVSKPSVNIGQHSSLGPTSGAILAEAALPPSN